MANQLEQVLKRTQAVYKQAAEELAKKLADFQARFAAKDKEKRALLQAGEITAEQYKSWLAGQVFQGKQWEAKAAEAAKTLVHADEEAAAIVNDGCMTAYAAAMNYGTYELEKATGLSTGFTLYNRETVSRLLAKDPQLLPYWKINEKKDYVWNYEKVKNALIEGILQGKKIPDIQQDFIGKLLTKDLPEKVQKQMENRMRLFARTGMTGAHNAGRMDALHRAEDKGIKVLKKWLATSDDRTRDSHADLDGQIREIDEPFTTTNRDGSTAEIDYPGDPSADPEQVYNCRCTLVYIYPELEEAPEDTEPAPEYEQMTFDQWVEAKENQEAVQGETKPETVTAEDAREPEPEIMAEAAELEQTEPEPETDQLAGLSESTIEAIESYTGGEEFSLNQDQFDEIKEKMETTTEPMYRVETAARTASDNALFEGDRFDFSQQVFESKDAEAGALRSFTRNEDALPDLLGQTDDAIIYRTTGEVDQLPVDQHSQYDQAESLTFANGWEVTGTGTMTIDGKDYEVIDIRQAEHIKPETAAEPAAAETITGPIMNGDRTVCKNGVEYGELFSSEQTEITAKTLQDLDAEDPLGRPLGEVVDVRVSRGIDQGIDHLDLYDENQKLVPCNAQYLSPGHNAPIDQEPRIEIHNESLSTQPLASEFYERHALREKYGDGKMEGSTAFDYAASSLEGTLRHEYAHALMDSYGFFGNGDEPLQKEAREWVLDFWQNHQHELLQISKYAASHPDEMIAECYVQIADRRHQGTIAYKTANTVITQMRGYIERAKGR